MSPKKSRKIPKVPAKNTKAIPYVGLSSPKASIPRGRVPSTKKWKFSFEHWRQIKYFGLNCERVSGKWFVSLLDKLQALSYKTLEDVLQDADSWRWHRINWNQKNIPITKESLDWLPKSLIESEEIEFYQFQISTALGRVVGFFDPDYTFQVVLLDPMHNAQPSKNYGYKVDDARVLNTEYQSLIHKIRQVKSKIESHCPSKPCEVSKLAATIEEFEQFSRHIFVDEAFDADISQMMQEYDYSDVFYFLVDAVDALKQIKASDTA